MYCGEMGRFKTEEDEFGGDKVNGRKINSINEVFGRINYTLR